MIATAASANWTSRILPSSDARSSPCRSFHDTQSLFVSQDHNALALGPYQSVGVRQTGHRDTLGVSDPVFFSKPVA